jgi:hypothetical protein
MLNGNIIPGATGPFVLPNGAGTYTVELGGSSNCHILSNPFSLTGINRLTANPEYDVYPNPSSGKWTIRTSNPGPETICELYDNEGRLVYSAIIAGSQWEIAPDVSSGIYLLKIFDSGQVPWIVKLVKL